MSRRGEPRPPDVSAVLSRLKGFQRHTVEYAFERLYTAPDSTRRFLVADEVGLGKTLVARGVIAKAIEHLWQEIDRIDVVYICSNAQIARQNVNRLQIEGTDSFQTADRLTLLPTRIRDLNRNKVNYLAFTPGTSFDLKSSLGRSDERVLLYSLVQRVWPRPDTGPKNLFQGWVGSAQKFRGWLDSFDPEGSVDRGLAAAFKKRLYEAGKSPGWGGEGLRKRYHELCDRFRYARKHVPQQDRRDQASLIGRMRALLAETCIRALEPDLVILDEFQRFKTILDGTDEAALLARELFNYSDAATDVRLLLLSATPYKMYTLHHEAEEDDHYADFLRTVEFLDPSIKEDGRLEALLSNYRRELYRLEENAQGLRETTGRIEAELRRVMSRTERLRTADESGGMLRERPTVGVQLTEGDVRDFVALQRVGQEVRQPQVIEYWKSAPYLLNFMDDYKLKTAVKEGLDAPRTNKALEAVLSANPGLLLSWEDIEAYEAVDPSCARLRGLLGWVDDMGAWKLLWLPPSMPYYRLEHVFARAAEKGITKQLIFSTWNVVPKTIASLVSYEAERRLFREFDSAATNTPEERKKRRPLLRFARTRGRLTGMPVLGLLYPSPTLAELGDPLRIRQTDFEGQEAPKLRELQSLVEQRLERRLEQLVEAHAVNDGEDEAWYWAAPILLDLEHHEETTRFWFAEEDLAQSWTGETVDDEDTSRWADHVEYARDLAQGRLALGQPPDDLAEILALRALAGPAVCSLRALVRAFGATAEPSAIEARRAAAAISWSFRTLFNQPEAMALIRAGNRDETPYWRRVLEYCAEGHLQAVLDEYLHLVRDLQGLFDYPAEEAYREATEALGQALTLRTGNPRLDEIRHADNDRDFTLKERRIRSHFAIRFGTQEGEDGQAGAREDQVRAAFNSPFWPFLLTTTSVGQEGLDFHAYCHAVMHWNLPSNPVDLEQREGRVHRYKGLAIRKNVAKAHGEEALAGDAKDAWNRAFELAEESCAGIDHGLTPYWVFSLPDGAFIERHVPALPLSRDALQIEALRRSLAVYRMVFGQPQQDDLMAYLLERVPRERLEELKAVLRVDLSPGGRVAAQES